MKPKQSLGLASILASAFFYGSYGVWSRLMVGGFGEFNQAWIRAILVLTIIVPFGLITHAYKRIEKSDLKWFVVISLAGGLNQAPYYFGFRYLDVGIATLLFYGALTVGVFIIGKFFFAEKITRIKLLALVLGILGLVIISGISLITDKSLTAAALVVIAGTLGACTVAFPKKLSLNYSEVQILTILFGCMLVCNLIFNFFVPEPLPPSIISIPWLAQIMYTIAQLSASLFMIKGFSLLQPAIAALLGLTEVIFAIILGMLIFGEQLTPSIVVGSLLILTAAALPQASKLFRR
jgi:drug/metabolite transporter (DMT)-like permease